MLFAFIFFKKKYEYNMKKYRDDKLWKRITGMQKFV